MAMESSSKLSPDMVAAHGKYKARSHDTYTDCHLPELEQLSANNKSIDVVFIGDSMLERLKTTGKSTKVAQMPSTFNAGVGGDKIENVLYRLGLGMMARLSERNVRLWVVMVGTNNLKKALKPKEIELHRLLLQALLEMSPESRAITCEIFKRKDVDDAHVDSSNRLLQEVAREMNECLGEEKIFWQPAPTSITKKDLEDHVHLNEKAYGVWDEVLYPRIQELLA